MGGRLFRYPADQSISGLAGAVRIRPAGAVDRGAAAAAHPVRPRQPRRAHGGARCRCRRCGRLDRQPARGARTDCQPAAPEPHRRRTARRGRIAHRSDRPARRARGPDHPPAASGFDLLANLARVPDRPLSRDALLRAVWRLDFDPGTNRVEVHMSRLRAKVDRDFDWPMLLTVKGMGYTLRSRPD
ncbi:winged helix-turn-helix domain-containing protein [Sphingopyxis sp.]|uniref:winged helix-turn-helix domain-containing protein n=1 Tax=Sphingopyxis sp. TaxID=1908224 RepID=UPI002DF24748|nr:winged helix-turn-helix domain-containing protein [Sphingopyxis sp.]